MPYLTPKDKLAMDAGVQPRTAGELTYCLTKQLQRYLTEPLSYEKIAVALGALEGARADLIDRVLKPYEEKKCRENGDVW